MAEKSFSVILLVVSLSLAGCATTKLPEKTESSCVVAPPDAMVACTQEYNPICGCDGKTYPNACVARAQGVPRSTPGACEAGRLD